MHRKRVIISFLVFLVPLFNGLFAQSVKDGDGNVYLTINIGKQVWIAENLKTTKLNDGKSIELVTDDSKWKSMKTPAYCWYENNLNNKDIYGALYNYYAVKTRKLCPVGWHVSSEDDWLELLQFLGDPNLAGNRLKESGTNHWKNVLSKASDEFDFSARPGGMRFYNGTFPLFGDSYAIWWTSSEFDKTRARNRGLHDQSSRVYKGFDNFTSGFSVRCIKDK